MTAARIVDPIRAKNPNFVLPAQAAVRSVPVARLAPMDPVWLFGRGVISNTVKIYGTPSVPAQRRVGLYNRRSGQLVRMTWSDPVTGVYSFREIATDVAFFVASWDHTGIYDGVIHDNVYAVVP